MINMIKSLATVLILVLKERRDVILQKYLRFHIIRPWMKHREMMIISAILKQKKPKRCLEWGAGYSSLYFPKYIDKDVSWNVVENDTEWYQKIKRLNHRDNTELHLLKPNNPFWNQNNENGVYADFKDYIEFPKTLGVKFDFIIVDGKARKECLISCLDILASDGIVVLHNANRENDDEALRYYRNQIMFSEDGIHNGLWIGSNNLNIEKDLNISRFTQTWDVYVKISKLKRSFLSTLKKHFSTLVHTFKSL